MEKKAMIKCNEQHIHVNLNTKNKVHEDPGNGKKIAAMIKEDRFH